MSRNLRFEVAKTAPLQAMVKVDFGHCDRTPFGNQTKGSTKEQRGRVSFWMFRQGCISLVPLVSFRGES